MSVTENKVSRKAITWKRLNKLVCVSMNVKRLISRISIIIEFSNNHCWDFSFCYHSFAIPKAIFIIFRAINCEHRVLTCITFVEHFDRLCIPVFRESVVTVELHLKSFTVVMLLNLITSVISILWVLMPNILHNDGRWAGLLGHFLNILIEFLVLLPVILVPETILIINDYSQSLRISGFWNKGF